MLKKTLRRLLRIAAVFACLMITSIGVTAYVALQEPRFYAGLRTYQPTDAQVAAATARLEQERAAYLKWRHLLLASQRDAPGRVAAPKPGTHEVRFSDVHLNALLASETSGFAGGALEDPRVRITPDKIDFACGVLTPVARFVFSAALTPTLTPDGVLTLELASARIGRLPLPCDTIAGYLPRKVERLSGNLFLDLTAAKPRVTLDLAGKADALLAQSVECVEGEIAFRFVAQEPKD